MENKNKLITLWILTIIGMILHFNYHIGEIFYGVDVVKPGYDGKVPNSIFVIRNLFYHLPIVWVLLIIYSKKPWANFTLFLISCAYMLAHLGHLSGELTNEEKDPSQISLLLLVFAIAVILTVEHWKFWKKSKDHEKV